jgi:cytochrome c553
MMMTKRMLLALALAMPAPVAHAASVAPPGVAACSNCHPRSGADAAIPPLAGRSAHEIIAAMSAFRSGKRPSTVMARIVKGFTDDEIAASAAWYAAQL